MAMTGFAGFPLETQRFLAELGERQDRAWFESHRADYERAYIPGNAGCRHRHGAGVRGAVE